MLFRKLMSFSMTALLLAAMSCGGDDNPVTGPGGSGGVGGEGGEGAGGEGAGGDGGGGDMGDGNDSFETATPITIDHTDEYELDPPDTDVDFYTFEGTAGQWLILQANAKPMSDPYGDDYIDTVVTLYDANEVQIAFNDDVFPRFSQNSFLPTRLPTSGTYYIKVEDYCATAEGMSLCPEWVFEAKTDYSYRLHVAEPDETMNGYVEEVEPNDTPATANVVEFPANTLAYSYGELEEAGLDVYSFNIPTTFDWEGYRPAVWFGHYFGGPNNNGSTAAPGAMWLVHEASQEVVAYIDQPETGQKLTPPITPGDSYQLYVEAPAGSLGDNPFYYTGNFHFFVGQVEQDEAGNDTTPEPAPVATDAYEGVEVAWLWSGDIVDPTDVDKYSLELPPGLPDNATVGFTCLAERHGSGLRGMHAVLSTGSDATVLGEGTEGATQVLTTFTAPAVVPPGETQLVVEIDAPMVDATVDSTWYLCEAAVFAGT